MNNFELANSYYSDKPLKFLENLRIEAQQRGQIQIAKYIRDLVKKIRDYAIYRAISITKGINPFLKASDKDVDPDYYNYARTQAYKDDIRTISKGMGIDDGYFDPDLQKKYIVLRDWMDRNGLGDKLDSVVLTADGNMQYADLANKVKNVMVANKDDIDNISWYIKNSTDPSIAASDVNTSITDIDGDNYIIDADYPAIQSYMAAKIAGKDKDKNRITIDGTDYDCIHTDGYTIAYNEKSAVIVSYTGQDQDIKIPDKINIQGTNIPVTGLYNGSLAADTIKSVAIPSSINYYGKYIFGEFGGKKDITVYQAGGDTTKMINGCLINRDELIKSTPAFDGKIPDGISIIRESAFVRSDIQAIDLSDAKVIYPGAFAGCTNLKTVSGTPDKIYDHAFYYDRSLTDIDLSHTEIVEDKSFYCSGLKSVDLTSCSHIGEFAFAGSHNLDSAKLNAAVLKDYATGAYDSAFDDTKTQPTWINLPDHVQDIMDHQDYVPDYPDAPDLNYSIPDDIDLPPIDYTPDDNGFVGYNIDPDTPDREISKSAKKEIER